jgi:hypothetical protein
MLHKNQLDKPMPLYTLLGLLLLELGKLLLISSTGASSTTGSSTDGTTGASTGPAVGQDGGAGLGTTRTG